MTSDHRSEARQPWRIGLVGAGSIAGAHALGYLQHNARITVAAVADTNPVAARQLADRFSAQTFRDLPQMLDSLELDGIDICLPHNLHAAAVRQSLAAGIPVLVEKPLCTTESDAAQIVREATERGVSVMAGHNQLHTPTVAAARRAIDDGMIGRPLSVRVHDCFRAGFTPDTIGWRGDPTIAGGGVLIDTGYHPTYLLRHLVGSDPTDVFARLATHRLSFLAAEDTATVLYRFPGEITGSVETSWAYGLPTDERFAVVGTDGTITATDSQLTVSPVEGEPVELDFPPVNTVAAEIAAFADCLDGRPAPNNGRDAAAVLRMILAAYRSAATGALTEVPEG